MIRTWELKFEVFWDASRTYTVQVMANTERKAVIFGTEKVKKETGWDMPKLLSCKEIY
jgi:hypothetical protein